MADVTTTFAAKDENFAKTIDSLQKKLDGFSKNMGNLSGAMMGVVGKVAGLAAGFMAAQSAIGAFREAIDLGGNLAELSDRTGETAGNLMILQRAFQNSGAGADSVGQQLNRLQRFMYEARDASSEQSKALSALGLSYADLSGKAPIDQMQMLAAKISGISDPGQRAATAMSIFGKSGGELLPLLRGMTAGIDQARAQLGSAPKLADELGKSLDTLGENFAAIAGKGTEFALGLLKDVTPALVAITTEIANLDAAGLGEKLSRYIARTMEWAKETFKLGEAFKNIRASINAIIGGDFAGGFALMFDTATVAGKNMINILYAAASASIATISKTLQDIFNPSGALVALVKTTFQIAVNYIKEGMYNVLADFMSSIGRSGMAETFKYEAETAARSIEQLTFGLSGQMVALGDQISDSLNKAPKEFADAYEANMKDPLFEIGEQTKKNAQRAKELQAAYEDAAKSQQASSAAKPAAPPLEPTSAPAPAAKLAPAPTPSAATTAASTRAAATSSTKAKTYLEALGAQESDYSVAKSMKINDQLSRDQARAQKLAERGSYSAAASVLRRSKERAERRAKRSLTNELDSKMAKQALQPEDVKANQGKAGAESEKKAASDPLIKWLNDNLYKWMQENLPSHALT